MNLELWRKRLWHLRRGGVGAVREFERRRRFAAVPLGRRAGPDLAKPVSIAEIEDWPIPDPLHWRGRRSLRAGVIADPFTAMAFDYEWDQLLLDPESWATQLEETPLDLLFVESAWHGNDNRWQYQLTGSKAPSEPLRAIVAHCQECGIPTVFWNKEDPVHFEDFLDTARIFDWVFTTDVNKVKTYKDNLGHDRVGVLPFAAQPAIHNPIRPLGAAGERKSVAFAGTYFRDKFPERREQMDILLGGAMDAESRLSSPLDIYSRFREISEAYRFPEPFASRVRGELTYPQMLTANRSYNAMINVNSVVGSPSMCARRVFEVTACGTPVVGVRSEAVSNFFPPEEVVQVIDRQDAERWFRALDCSPELRDRMVHLAQRRIWREHTYGQRIEQVLNTIGLERFSKSSPTITAIISTNRPHQIEHVLQQMANQHDANLQVIVLTHGFAASDSQEATARELGLEVGWIEGEGRWTLGECYNALVARAEGDYIAKIDDDDLYGPYYLFDQVNALAYANADIVGKHAHYMYLSGRDALCLRFPRAELQWSHFVAGPTILARAEVFRANPFRSRTVGEDSEFLRDARASGARVFASDRFGFVQMRGESQRHTWTILDSEVLASSRVFTFGRNFDHVLF